MEPAQRPAGRGDGPLPVAGTTTRTCPRRSSSRAVRDRGLAALGPEGARWPESGIDAARARARSAARRADPRPVRRPGREVDPLGGPGRATPPRSCAWSCTRRGHAPCGPSRERMGARLDVRVGDGRTWIDGGFDAVLVDPPCTGLGVLELATRMLAGAAARRPLRSSGRCSATCSARALELTRPGGRVVYSTCTLLAAENEDVGRRASGARLADLGARFPDWAHPRLAGALLDAAGTRRHRRVLRGAPGALTRRAGRAHPRRRWRRRHDPDRLWDR